MNVVAQARKVLAQEFQAFEADHLRYAPQLKPFVAQHGLLPLVDKAWQLMCQHGERGLGRPAGYPFFHGARTARNALSIADSDELHGVDIDRVALFAAALFHDVSHTDRGDDHQAAGAQVVKQELAGLLAPERHELVAQLVHHSDNPDAACDRIESKILYDANTLDLQGAIYFWRAATFAGAQGVGIEPALVALQATLAIHREWTQKVHFEVTRAALRAKSDAEDHVIQAMAAEVGMGEFLQGVEPRTAT